MAPEDMCAARLHYELARLLGVSIGTLRVYYDSREHGFAAAAPARSLLSLHAEHACADGFLLVRYRCAACKKQE